MNVQITEIQQAKSFYSPGETVSVTVLLKNEIKEPTKAVVRSQITHLTQMTSETSDEVTLGNGNQSLKVTFAVPSETPMGYGLDIVIETINGTQVAKASTAFDVLDAWYQMPRYGFLVNYDPGRSDIAETMDTLTRYHINGLQFYDWMYRHEQFLTSEEPYKDLLGRTLSRATVDSLIASAHDHQIAAMPYTAVYGASIAFYHEHPDWALLKSDGSASLFGDNFMVIMDPRPDSAWTKHLMAQFEDILDNTKFDGIHLDQYGDPKVGYDNQGNSYDLAQPLAAMIDQTHQIVDSKRKNGAVVFNAVTNWPIEAVAPADEDIVYIEVWPPYTWFDNLHSLITSGQKLGGGKPVVLAAYINPADEINARLMDAVIFASGAGHIELGEKDGMLADAYFPKYEVMSAALAADLHKVYDFIVRYENVTGPQTADGTRAYAGKVKIDGYSTSSSLMTDKIWPIIREGNGFTTINLINFMGVSTPEWKTRIESAPTQLGQISVHVSGQTRTPKAIWMASPDGTDLAPQEVEFTTRGDTTSFNLPGLIYWDMVVIEWAD